MRSSESLDINNLGVVNFIDGVNGEFRILLKVYREVLKLWAFVSETWTFSDTTLWQKNLCLIH